MQDIKALRRIAENSGYTFEKIQSANIFTQRPAKWYARTHHINDADKKLVIAVRDILSYAQKWIYMIAVPECLRI